MATVTRYVDTASSGGDGTTQNHSGGTAAYASLAAWDAAEQTNLITDTDVHVVNCAGGADASYSYVVEGWSSDATYFITIQGDSTAPDGDGVNPTGVFSASYYHVLVTSGGTASGLELREAVLVQDLQFYEDATADITVNHALLYHAVNAKYFEVKRCIFESDSDATGAILMLWDASVTPDTLYESCTFNHTGTNAAVIGAYYQSAASRRVQNCSFFNLLRGVQSVASFSSGTITVRNCAFGNNTDDFVNSGLGSHSIHYCASDDLDGANAVDISPLDEATGWGQAVHDYASGDFRLHDLESPLYNAGTPLGLPSTDVTGKAFTTNDIGAFAMAAIVERYVDTASSGGDGTTQNHSGATAAYASLSAWEAAEQTNLVSDGNVHVVNCAGGADTTYCDVNGWTTGASNFITVQGDPSAPDGDGANPTGIYSTSYYRMSAGLSTADYWTTEAYTVTQDLQFEQTGTSGSGRSIHVGATDCVFRRIISYINQTTAAAVYGILVVGDRTNVNSSVFTSSNNSYGVGMQGNSAPDDWVVQNCTFAKLSYGLAFVASSTGNVARNCAFLNNSTTDISDAATGSTIDYCASDDLAGTNAHDMSPAPESEAYNWGLRFNDYANGNFDLGENSPLRGQGTLVGLPRLDVRGGTFEAPDIGANRHRHSPGNTRRGSLTQSKLVA